MGWGLVADVAQCLGGGRRGTMTAMDEEGATHQGGQGSGRNMTGEGDLRDPRVSESYVAVVQTPPKLPQFASDLRGFEQPNTSPDRWCTTLDGKLRS